MKVIYALVLAGFAVASASGPAWTDLRGSFLILKDESFAPFPRSKSDPLFTSENWIPAGQTSDCTNGGLFNGIQYVKNGDMSVGLLMDKQGTFAGIQMLIKHSDVLTADNHLRYDIVKMYQNATYDGVEYFVLTAYTVDPTTVCTTGRPASALQTEGTGSGIWVQNGPGPDSFLEVPFDRPEGDTAVTSGWTENNCFPAMGYHNFYRQDTYESTQCKQLDPFFALYGRDLKLHGFGFITPGNIDNPRFEHPPQPAIKLILGTDKTPQCILDVEEKCGVTSIHVWFRPRPQTITCPIFRSAFRYAQSVKDWLSNLV